jgi:hypothetical protein
MIYEYTTESLKTLDHQDPLTFSYTTIVTRPGKLV